MNPLTRIRGAGRNHAGGEGDFSTQFTQITEEIAKFQDERKHLHQQILAAQMALADLSVKFIRLQHEIAESKYRPETEGKRRLEVE